MYFKRNILQLFIFLSSISSFAQQSKIDSLQKILVTAKEDTNKVNSLNLLSLALKNKSQFEKAMQYANDALSLSEKIKYIKGKANAYNIIGLIYSNQSNYSEALKNISFSLKLREKIKDKKGIANCYNNIGTIYKETGNYPEALKNHFAALKIREEIGDKTEIGGSYNNIGESYRMQGDFTEALKYYSACLTIMEQIGNKKYIALSYNNIGNIYAGQGKNSQALENYFASLKIRQAIGDTKGIAASYNNIGSIYADQAASEKNPEKRKQYYDNAFKNHFASLKIKEEIGYNYGMATSYGNIGNLFLKQEKYAEASEYFNKYFKLAMEMGSKDDIKESYRGLSAIDSAKGNYKSAYEKYKMFIIYRDSLINEENTKKIVQEQMQYEFDKKETKKKVEQEKKDAIALAEKKKQQVILYSVIGGLGIVLLFALFIFRSLVQIRKKNLLISEQKTHIEEKQKEILDSIHYAARIQRSILPTEKYIDKTLKRLMKN